MDRANHSKLNRRDWLKAATLSGAAAVFGSDHAQGQHEKRKQTQVRGVIFMVSDGMSPGVLTLAQAYSELTRRRGTEWWSLMNEKTVARGLMDTAAANSMVTDSAAASTAWGGGERVNNGSININPAGKSLSSIGEILKKSRARVGLVSTATITHATPAGFAANVADRNDEDAIASQYLDRVDVLLGGGSKFFDASTRADGRDLFGDFKKSGYGIVRDRQGLLTSRDEKLLGTFTAGHLPYTIDRDQNPDIAVRIPTLSEMTTAALNRMLAGDPPFLLQVEGARIDHAAHFNDIAALLHDQLAFDDAIATVRSLIAGRSDVLVVVTSDHGNSNPGLTGMGKNYKDSNQSFAHIQNMKSSYEALFVEWTENRGKSTAQLTEMVRRRLGFILKPEQAGVLIEVFENRPVVEWNEHLKNTEGVLGQLAGNHTGIGWNSTTHTSDPTLINAFGPEADRFSGIVRNTDVFGHLTDLLI